MSARIVFHVQDPNARPIGGALLSAVNVPHGNWQGVTNEVGDFVATLDAGIYIVTIAAPGYVSRTQTMDLALPGTVTTGLELAGASGRLSASANGLLNANGTPFTWAMVDSFRLGERLSLGENIDAVLDQIVQTGANGVRMLNDASWYRVYSKDIPDYFTRVLPLVAEKLTVRGLLGEMCCFGDWQQTQNGDLNRALVYWQNCIAIARQFPCFVLQLVNEGDQHGQNFPFAAFPMPDGVLSSRGSTGTGNNPPVPYGRGKWTFNSLGTERNENKIALSTSTIWWGINGYAGEGGQPDYEGTRWCTVVDEPPKVGTGYHTDPSLAYILGLGTRFHPNGQACGGTAHAEQALQTVLMDPITFACVTSFVRGVFEGRK